MEWSKDNRFNSFNSDKGLTYYEHYQQTVDWLDNGNSYLPPPIECNLDPYAECNLSCYFCINQRYLKHHREEVGEMRVLPKEYIYKLVDFLAMWGTRGLCISGGGEPSLHKGVWGLPSYAKGKGMDVSFVTNGVRLSDELIENMMSCRWASFSVNAGDRESYKAITGKDKFDDVIRNIERATTMRMQTGSEVDFCYRMLILPENYKTLHKACKIAKELGVQDFNVRPVDFERDDIEGHKRLQFDMKLMEEQFQRCHEEETDDFHVYTVTHKFDPEFHVQHNFSRCFATLILPILQDGYGYLCVDRKMEAKLRIGSAYPDPAMILDWWGSDRHRQLIKGVNVDECGRCVAAPYFKQIENVVIKDSMCVNFP